MYMRCLENGGWCRLVLEGRKERQNFKIDCREPAPAVTTVTTSACPATRRRKRANRPTNPRRQERERRRRAAWLERRESRQQPGPLTTSTPSEQQPSEQQPLEQPLEQQPSAAAIAATASVRKGARVAAVERRASARALTLARTRGSDDPEGLRSPEEISPLEISWLSGEREEPEDEEKEPEGEEKEPEGEEKEPDGEEKEPEGQEKEPEERVETEEGAEPVFRPPPTPPPWSIHFSSHPRRVLCTFCFAGDRDTFNSKCANCYRVEREKRYIKPIPSSNFKLYSFK